MIEPRLTPEMEAHIRISASRDDNDELKFWGSCFGVRYLLAEIDALRAQVAGHCERIAKQSELLSRKAEK